MAKASVKLFVAEGARVVRPTSAVPRRTPRRRREGLPVHCDVGDRRRRRPVRSCGGRVRTGRRPAQRRRDRHRRTDPQDGDGDYDKVMDVDLRGVFLGMKCGIRLRDAGGGAIVNWSSVGGLRASEQAMATSVYNAAKAGVVSLTKSASAEYGRKGVRVNCLCPGFIETEIMGASGGSQFPEIAKKASLGRGGRPRKRSPRSRSCVPTGVVHCPERSSPSTAAGRPTAVNEAAMTTTDFSATDLFRDRELPENPYPFYDWVREQGRSGTTRSGTSGSSPALRGSNRHLPRPAVVVELQHRQRPVQEDVGPLEGDDITQIIEEHRDELPFSDQLLSFDPPSTRAPRCSCGHHAEAAQGERGVPLVVRRSDHRPIHRRRAVRAPARLCDALHHHGDRRPPRRARRRPCDAFPRAPHHEGARHAWSTSRSASTSSSPATSRTAASTPRDDVMTEMAQATLPRRTLPPVEDVMRIGQPVLGRQRTTARLIGMCVRTLGDHPEFQQRLSDDHSLIAPFIEEMLRTEGAARARSSLQGADHRGEGERTSDHGVRDDGRRESRSPSLRRPRRVPARPAQRPPAPGLRQRHPQLRRRPARPGRDPRDSCASSNACPTSDLGGAPRPIAARRYEYDRPTLRGLRSSTRVRSATPLTGMRRRHYVPGADDLVVRPSPVAGRRPGRDPARPRVGVPLGGGDRREAARPGSCSATRRRGLSSGPAAGCRASGPATG